MKRDKLTFLIAELILIVLAAFFIHKIFQEDVAPKACSGYPAEFR